MKYLLIIVAFLVVVLFSCKCKNNVSKTDVQQYVIGKTMGVVSHKYKNTECGKTLIFINNDEENTIIPIEGLPDNLNIDGQKLYFSYTALLMPQPRGCTIGIPSKISNVGISY